MLFKKTTEYSVAFESILLRTLLVWCVVKSEGLSYVLLALLQGGIVLSATPTMAELLTAQFPPIVSQTQIAQIFGQHVQTVRRLARAGLLPFANISISSAEKRYR